MTPGSCVRRTHTTTGCCSLWLSGYVEQKTLVTDVKLYNAARRAAMAQNADFLKTAVSAPRYLSCSNLGA